MANVYVANNSQFRVSLSMRLMDLTNIYLWLGFGYTYTDVSACQVLEITYQSTQPQVFPFCILIQIYTMTFSVAFIIFLYKY